jgi:hypothetical protein
MPAFVYPCFLRSLGSSVISDSISPVVIARCPREVIANPSCDKTCSTSRLSELSCKGMRKASCSVPRQLPSMMQCCRVSPPSNRDSVIEVIKRYKAAAIAQSRRAPTLIRRVIEHSSQGYLLEDYSSRYYWLTLVYILNRDV